MILGCSSQEAVGPTTTTLSHTVYDHHLRYFGWGYPHVSNWLSNMGPWLFFLMEVIESFLWLEHHASGTKSLCCNSHCDSSMMGVSNTSREVTQCSSVSTAVNNRRSAAERNFFDMFISKRFIPSCYIQTYSVYFLPLGSYTRVREGLHALLMGTANRFGKGDSDRSWLQGNATDFYYLLVTGVLQSSFPTSYCAGSMLPLTSSPGLQGSDRNCSFIPQSCGQTLTPTSAQHRPCGCSSWSWPFSFLASQWWNIFQTFQMNPQQPLLTLLAKFLSN